MLPIVTALCVLIGYDSFTGFLVCIIACGFGFASAITNPFTVVLASGLIGTSVTSGILFRCLVFAVMFGLDAAFLLRHLKRIAQDPRRSPTFEADERRRAELQELPKEAESRRLTA